MLGDVEDVTVVVMRCRKKGEMVAEQPEAEDEVKKRGSDGEG